MTEPSYEDIERAAAAAKEQLRHCIRDIERASDEQHARLDKARSEADEARGWQVVEASDDELALLAAGQRDGIPPLPGPARQPCRSAARIVPGSGVLGGQLSGGLSWT